MADHPEYTLLPQNIWQSLVYTSIYSMALKETPMQYTWNDIENHIAVCTQCPLGKTRNRPVMGKGDHQADIMLIAEAPGAQEDEQGIPFVGRSGGELSQKYIKLTLYPCSCARWTRRV